jgi:predicted lipoprotein with Yx(FWY)xxD motif
MTRFLRPARPHGVKVAAATIVATSGFGAAALVGVALAKTFTLQVAKNARVTNQSGATKTENIAVNSRGFAVYMLTGDSKSHPKCTKANGCFSFWPPLRVSSPKQLSKATGIKGRLGVWHRDGFSQVTLAGHPLYRYAGDSQRHSATGQGVVSFGGTWHVEEAAGSTSGSAPTPAPTTTMTTTTSTTTTCLYPPCY